MYIAGCLVNPARLKKWKLLSALSRILRNWPNPVYTHHNNLSCNSSKWAYFSPATWLRHSKTEWILEAEVMNWNQRIQSENSEKLKYHFDCPRITTCTCNTPQLNSTPPPPVPLLDRCHIDHAVTMTLTNPKAIKIR